MKLASLVSFVTFATTASLPFVNATTCAHNCTDTSGGNSCDPKAQGFEYCTNFCGGGCDNLASAGCGSCLGDNACTAKPGWMEYLIVADNACVGFEACKDTKSAIIGDGSCYSTNYGQSCRGLEYAAIEPNACFYANACSYAKHITIGRKSCRGKKSCYKAAGAGGNNPGCGYWMNPDETPIAIAPKSCRGKQACCGINRTVGAEECNGDYACCNPDVDGCTCGM